MGSGFRGSGWVESNARTQRRGQLFGVAVLTALALPAPAHAAPVSLDLEWRAPSGCPDRNAVRRYVEEMLGNAEAATSSLAARGGVSRVAIDRWTADLALRSGSGYETTRSFEGPTCESVSRAAALVMALTLHPNELRPPPPNPERDTRAPERPIVGRFARPFVAASAAMDAGSLPGPAYGGAIGAGWALGGVLRLETSGAFFAARRATVANTDLGASVSLAALSVRGCYPLVDAGWSFAPCVGGGLDWLHASGFGARSSYDGSAFTSHVEAGATILWNLTEFFALRASVFGVAPMTRPEFTIWVDNYNTAIVHRSAPAALRATGGVELHF
jgi:hypothetical protein